MCGVDDQVLLIFGCADSIRRVTLIFRTTDRVTTNEKQLQNCCDDSPSVRMVIR